MARRVFFSFHFENDIWRVNQVRNANVVHGVDQAGFFDHSEYIEAKKKGDDNIKRLIRQKLEGTSVTIVLIGSETASRPYVQYEIAQSVERGNGVFGVRIHHLKDQYGNTTWGGPIPSVPYGTEFPVISWNAQDLSEFKRQIEAAGNRSDRKALAKALVSQVATGRRW